MIRPRKPLTPEEINIVLGDLVEAVENQQTSLSQMHGELSRYIAPSRIEEIRTTLEAAEMKLMKLSITFGQRRG